MSQTSSETWSRLWKTKRVLTRNAPQSREKRPRLPPLPPPPAAPARRAAGECVDTRAHALSWSTCRDAGVFDPSIPTVQGSKLCFLGS